MPQQYTLPYDRHLVAKVRRSAKQGADVMSVKTGMGYESYVDGKLAGITKDSRVHFLVGKIGRGYHSATLQPGNASN